MRVTHQSATEPSSVSEDEDEEDGDDIADERDAAEYIYKKQ